MKKIMPWIDHLEGVGATDFLVRRDHIDLLLRQAQQTSDTLIFLLAQAYIQTAKLEGEVKAFWSEKEVERARSRLGVVGALPIT
jgi:hypothetical protein